MPETVKRVEQFLVAHAPKDAGLLEEQTFTRKGTAMAYVKRKLPTTLNGVVKVTRQTAGDDRTWITVDTWNYHSDGHIDHSRS